MRLFRVLSTALTLILAAACGGDDPSSPSASHVGTYNLSTVGGSPLPVTITVGTDQVVVRSGRITLEANGSFAQETTVQVTVAGLPPITQTINCSGSYRLSGGTITLTGQSGAYCEGSETGTLDHNTLTVTLEGVTAVFTR